MPLVLYLGTAFATLTCRRHSTALLLVRLATNEQSVPTIRTKRVLDVIAALIAVIVMVPASAQQTPPSPPLLAFGDSQSWIMLGPLVYTIGTTSDRIVVPAGFVTDLASIPPEFWGAPLKLTPTGQYSRAAIIHDYLYWSQKCTRDQADRLLVIAMKESNVGGFDAVAIYEGVHLGGERAWRDNAEAKVQGLPRILPADYRAPPDPNMAWPEYAKGLQDLGVTSLDPPDDGSYCRYGDTTDVPRGR